MIAAIVFCSSTAGACQFGLHYFRATITRVAAQPVSDRVRTVVGISPTGVKPRDFRALMSVARMAPDLEGCDGSLKSIQAYYVSIEALGRLVPRVAGWSEKEMVTCSRYVAARLSQRLERNFAFSAAIRDF